MSLSERIMLNGVELQTVIPDAHILDIQVGPVITKNNTMPRTSAPGMVFSSRRDEYRSLNILVELPLDKEMCQRNYNRLRAWAEYDQPAPLFLPGGIGEIAVQFADMTELSVSEWYKPITITFEAYDPYFYGAWMSESCAANTAKSLTISGDVDAHYIIEAQIASAVTSPSWSFDNGAFVIALSGTVPTGSLVIDSSKGLVSLSGNSINNLISLASRFNVMKRGRHTITSSIASTIKWREGYK